MKAFAYLNCFAQLSMSLTVALKPFYRDLLEAVFKIKVGRSCSPESVLVTDLGVQVLPLPLRSFHNVSTKGGHLLVLYSKRKFGRPHRGLSQISFWQRHAIILYDTLCVRYFGQLQRICPELNEKRAIIPWPALPFTQFAA